MDDPERIELTSGLFVMLTTRLEDGAELAATGQASVSCDARRQLATSLATIGREVTTLAEAALALCSVEQAPG